MDHSFGVGMAPVKLDLDRYVPGLLLWLSNKMSASASALYRERFNLGVTDWRVLAFAFIYPWSTAAQACQLMGIDKAAVSRSLAYMVELKLLTSRPSGLRKVEYAVTPEGRKVYHQVSKLAFARERRRCSAASSSAKRTS